MRNKNRATRKVLFEKDLKKPVVDRSPDYHIQLYVSRKVLSPEYGPEAYYNSSYELRFTYGKGKQFKDGASAKRFVKSKLTSRFLSDYNTITMWKSTKNSGTVIYNHKQHMDVRFSEEPNKEILDEYFEVEN